MYHILLGEFFKFYKRPIALFITIFTVVIFILAVSFMSTVQMTENGVTTYRMMKYLTFPMAGYVGVEIASKMMSFLVLIMIASLLGNEYGWNTHKTIAIRGTDKLQFINSKLIAVFIFVVFLSLLGIGVFALLAYFMQSEILTHVQPDTTLPGYFVPAYFLLFLFSVLLYLTAGLFTTVLTKSSGLGIAVTMVYFFVAESILKFILTLLAVKYGKWLDDISFYLPGELMGKILDDTTLTAGGIQDYWSAIVKPLLASGAFSILFYIGSLAIIKKRDILN